MGMSTWRKQMKIKRALRKLEQHRLMMLLIMQARKAREPQQALIVRTLAIYWLPARMRKQVDQTLKETLTHIGYPKNTE